MPVIQSEYGLFRFDLSITPKQLEELGDWGFFSFQERLYKELRQHLFEQKYGKLPTDEQWAKIEKFGWSKRELTKEE